MEVTRRRLGAGEIQELRSKQLTARQMLSGELERPPADQHVEDSILTTTLDRAANWARANAIFPATFGLACCAIEMMSIVGARVDVARFGGEAFRASPRQADLLILSGRVSIKMAPVVRRIYDQMIEPRWAIAMGACSSSMGVFNNYAIVPGRQVHARRRARARLPAAARGAHARDPQAAGDDPGHGPTWAGGRATAARGTEEFIESELAIEPVAGHAIGVVRRRQDGHECLTPPASS